MQGKNNTEEKKNKKEKRDSSILDNILSVGE